MNSTAMSTETVTALLSQHKHLFQDLLTNKNFIYFTSAAQKSTKNSEQTLEYLLYKCVKNLEKIYRKQRPNCEPTSHIQYKHPIQNLSCYSLEHRK